MPWRAPLKARARGCWLRRMLQLRSSGGARQSRGQQQPLTLCKQDCGPQEVPSVAKLQKGEQVHALRQGMGRRVEWVSKCGRCFRCGATGAAGIGTQGSSLRRA